MGCMYALTWKLLIIGLLLNILQHYSKYYTEENSQKMFHISLLIVHFSYWKVKDIFDKDQISSGEGKRKG